MARSHSHAVKRGEARKARRRKRKQQSQRLVVNVEFALAWVCDDASCVAAHGGVA